MALAVMALAGCASGVVDMASGLKPEATAFKAEAGAAFSRRDYNAAFLMYNKALMLDRSLDSRVEEAFDLINMGRTLVASGRFADALPFLKEAASIAGEMHEDLLLGEAYATLAKVGYLSGSLQEASQYIEKAIDIDRAIKKEDASHLNIMAQVYLQTGRTDDAEELLEKTIKLSREKKNGVELANSLRLMGAVNSSKDNLSASLKAYREAYEVDSSLGDPVKISLDLLGIADAYYMNKEYMEALSLFQRAYRAGISSGFHEGALRGLDGLIYTYKRLGDDELAGKYLTEKDALMKRIKGD